MIIFNDYELSDALFDLPCIIGNTKIYPTRVSEYKKFQKYSKYIIFSKAHYGVPDDYEDSLLRCSIYYNVMALRDNSNNSNKDNMEYSDIVFRELQELFSIICRDEIKFSFINNTYNFINKDGLVLIDENNFDTIRKILLKLNMIFEPKIYKNEIERKWEEKAMIARSRKSTTTDFTDILNIISCSANKSYEDIYKQNIIQLYSDYFRCINTENSRTTSLFQSVDSSYKGANFTDSMIEFLFQNPYEGLWKDKSNLLGKL